MNEKRCPTCHRPMLLRKRVVCPKCGKEVSITPLGNYNTHNRPGVSWREGRCKASKTQVEPNFLGENI